MSPLLDKLPTILVLCALLGIFVSLRRHAMSRSVGLWIFAWAFVLVHFVAQGLESGPPWRLELFGAVDLCGLLLSAVVFTASTIPALVEDRRRLLLYYVVVGAPTFAYVLAASFSVDRPWLYVICLGISFFGGAVLVVRSSSKIARADWIGLATLLALGSWAMAESFRHAYDNAVLVLLATGFALPAIGFARSYRRWSPGVVTTTAGFLCWGCVFPAGALADLFLPAANVNPELWNVPKFFVAFGMILTMLEDKSLSLELARRREHEANQQMQRFAHITSQLLLGADPKQVCEEVAEAISRYSNFQRVSILFDDDEGRLLLGGHSGLTETACLEIQEKVQRWKTSEIAALCSAGQRVGPNSFLLKYAQLAKYSPVRSVLEFAPNPHWENGDEIFVPLRSPSGRCLGAITVDDPRDVLRVTPEETSKIELLAADLAVSLDNKTLQRQLIRSEKLAALGKLVSGAAHELNNPLTSIAGYAELLRDEVPASSSRDKLDKITLATRRMHGIIDKLLRFGRRTTLDQAPMDLAAVARDAFAVCEYKLRTHAVELQTAIDASLPAVMGDEAQMRQVFVHLLSNAVEAMQDMPERRLRVEIGVRAEKLCIRFLDSGPGFPDLNRAFDPFFTTKPVGQGTGLGLSICYGLIKEHGGEIYAENLVPSGGAVVIELPLLPASAAKPVVLQA